MAASRSVSAKMMFRFFPPSSSDTFLNNGAHASATFRPVTVPPVNEIVLIFWMRRDRSADAWAGSMHDVENAIRQSGFEQDIAKHVSRHWRQLARFSNGCVTDRDGRRDFPAQQIQRQIPRRNQSGDAARLAQRVVERNVVSDVCFGFGVKDCGGEETEIATRARNVERVCE